MPNGGTFYAVYCDAAVTSRRVHAGLGIVTRSRKQPTRSRAISIAGLCSNVVAEALAVAVALEELPAGSIVTVRTDCEAVIRRHLNGTGAGSHDTHPVWARIAAAAARHLRVKLKWIRGHAGVAAQVQSHRLARAATLGPAALAT